MAISRKAADRFPATNEGPLSEAGGVALLTPPALAALTAPTKSNTAAPRASVVSSSAKESMKAGKALLHAATFLAIQTSSITVSPFAVMVTAAPGTWSQELPQLSITSTTWAADISEVLAAINATSVSPCGMDAKPLKLANKFVVE